MPITRAFLASYYDNYPFAPLSTDVSRLSDQIYAMATDLLQDSPPTQGGFSSFRFTFLFSFRTPAVLLNMICD